MVIVDQTRLCNMDFYNKILQKFVADLYLSFWNFSTGSQSSCLVNVITAWVLHVLCCNFTEIFTLHNLFSTPTLPLCRTNFSMKPFSFVDSFMQGNIACMRQFVMKPIHVYFVGQFEKNPLGLRNSYPFNMGPFSIKICTLSGTTIG